MFRLNVILLSLLVSGCIAPKPPAPPPEDLRRSSANEGAKQISDRFPGIKRSAFIVFSSDDPIEYKFTANGSSFSWESNNPRQSKIYSGLATALTTDGYLLTAAHSVRPHCGVVGYIDGSLQTAKCRIVYDGRDTTGEDFAILHIGYPVDYALPLNDLTAEEEILYAFSFNRLGSTPSVDILSGQLIKDRLHPIKEKGILLCDIPFYMGDSGGGVMTKDGKLIGINLGAQRSFFSSKSYRRIYIPNRDLINEIIAEDRLKN
ncbi:MAG: serine protease [Verrucomicrobiota bacterium]